MCAGLHARPSQSRPPLRTPHFCASAGNTRQPKVGHATYLFAKPSRMEQFLDIYAQTNKEDIRKNRGDVAEKLGFLGRVVHGSTPRLWLKSLKSRLGEAMDQAEAVEA